MELETFRGGGNNANSVEHGVSKPVANKELYTHAYTESELGRLSSERSCASMNQ